MPLPVEAARHVARNAAAKSNRPTGSDGPRISSSTWPASRAIRAIVSCPPARSSPCWAIRFCAANIIWKRWRSKRDRVMTAWWATMAPRKRSSGFVRRSPRSSWRCWTKASRSTAIRMVRIWSESRLMPDSASEWPRSGSRTRGLVRRSIRTTTNGNATTECPTLRRRLRSPFASCLVASVMAIGKLWTISI